MSNNIRQIFKPILIDDILKNHTQIHIDYKNKKSILYVSYINGYFFININSLSLPEHRVDKWKRRRLATDKIKELDTKYKPMLSVYSFKNKGTWIIKDLFTDYGNWLGEVNKKLNNNDDLIDYGTFINKHFIQLYKDSEKIVDPYFMKLKNNFIRINRNTNFINLTDMLEVEDRDIRNFKKHSSCVSYLNDNTEHYISGNDSVDEFGIKVSYGHPDLALILVEWLYKEESEIKTTITNFINNIKKKFEKSETVKEHENIKETENLEIEKDKKTSENLILNGIDVLIRLKDGYINLTQLCKAGGKEFYHWKENKNTEAFFQALSSSIGIPGDELIKYETGSNENRATWGHRLVAIEIARWISPDFGVKMIRWTDEILITGKVELGNEKSNSELENLYQEKILLLENKIKEIEEKPKQHIIEFNNLMNTIKENNEDTMLRIIKNSSNEFRKYNKDFSKYNVLYMAFVNKVDEKYIFKFGETSDYLKRRDTHFKNINFKNFEIIIVVKCYNSLVCEREFRHYLKDNNFYYKYGGSDETFYILNEDMLLDVKYNFKKICKLNRDNYFKNNDNYNDNNKNNNIHLYREMLKNNEISFEQFSSLVK